MKIGLAVAAADALPSAFVVFRDDLCRCVDRRPCATPRAGGRAWWRRPSTDDDWGMRLVLQNVVDLGDGPAPPGGGRVGRRKH